MKPQSFIFIGRSGCGKGTQIKMLSEYLIKKDATRKFITISTGEFLREFIKGPSLTQKMCNEAYGSGGLQPEFITVHMWVKPLVDYYTGNEHIFFDGTPRKYHEAGVLHSVFGFYKLSKPFVINIDITAEEATRRLLARKRIDDSAEDIKKRLSWYETDVVPTIGYYSDSADYDFIKVNGERPIEEIHDDIVKKLHLD